MTSFENVCRLCTKNTNSSIKLHHTDTDKVKYIDKLKFIFNDLILDEDSKTPFKICPTCWKKLKQTYDFKKQCCSSYEYWLIHFNKNKVKKEPNSPNSIEIKPEDAPATRKRGRPRKVQTENQLMVTKQNSKLGSVLKPSNSEPNPDILNLKNKLTTLLKPEPKIKQEFPAPIQLNFTSLKSKLGDALKIGIQNIEEEQEPSVRKTIMKNRSKEKYFFFHKSLYIIDVKINKFYCKSCNKHFLNMKCLKRHIIRDLRIKNVLCKLCKKQFFSYRELKLHIVKHVS